MKIQLNLFTYLAKFAKNRPDGCDGSSWPIECEAGTTVRSLLSVIGIPLDHVKLIFINGVHQSLGTEVKDGDRVGVFPPVGGG